MTCTREAGKFSDYITIGLFSTKVQISSSFALNKFSALNLTLVQLVWNLGESLVHLSGLFLRQSMGERGKGAKYLSHLLIFHATPLQLVRSFSAPRIRRWRSTWLSFATQSRREQRWKTTGRAIIAREKNNSFSRASSCPGRTCAAPGGSLRRMIPKKTRFGRIGEPILWSTAASREMPSLAEGPTGRSLPRVCVAREIVPYYYVLGSRHSMCS